MLFGGEARAPSSRGRGVSGVYHQEGRVEAQVVGPSNNYCSARVRLLLRAQSTIRLYIECIVVRGVIHYSFALHATIGLEAHHIRLLLRVGIKVVDE